MECSLEYALANSMDRGEDGKHNEHLHSPSNVSALISVNTSDTGQGAAQEIGTTQTARLGTPFKLLHKASLKDIRKLEHEIIEQSTNTEVLESDRARVLEVIYQKIGSKQVKKRELEFAPSWITEQAFEKEFKDNWADAFQEVKEAELPAEANIIRSQVGYEIKTDEPGSR